jgi:hypothetical protein
MDFRVEVSLTFLVGVALGYYAFKHYAQNGKAV